MTAGVITKNAGSWDSDNNYVEQAMENAMYASAHADDTLVLVGPPRFSSIDDLRAVGALQNLSISQSRQVIPHDSIGTSRTFFQASKTRVNGSIGRLFINGKSLFAALYQNLLFDKEGKADYKLKNDTNNPFNDGNKNYVVDLDSAMFRVPFGLCILYRDKAKNAIGGLYIEMCVIPNWNTGIQGGAATLVEGTSFLADRIRPIHLGSLGTDKSAARHDEMNDAIAGGSGGNTNLKDRLDEILSI